MREGVPEAVVVHIGCNPISGLLGLHAAGAHADALGRDIHLGVARGDGVGQIGTEMLHEHAHGMGLIDTPNPKVAEQRMLALAAPCTRFEVGELLDRIKMVLIVRQNETHFVEVVAVELGTIHDAVKDVVDLEPIDLLGRSPLAQLILAQYGPRRLLEVFARKQTVVALEVELKAAAVQPVHDTLALVECDELVHHDLVCVLDVRTVAANHAVEADCPDFRRILGLAAARAHIDAVAASASQPNRANRRRRDVVLVVRDGSIDVEKNDLAIGHGASFPPAARRELPPNASRRGRHACASALGRCHRRTTPRGEDGAPGAKPRLLI